VPFPDESFSERVEVSPYREDWAAEAAGYVAVLRDAVPGARGVDHIGSTSVPGLPAKDCLDLMVRVAVLDEDVLVPALAEHGFRLRVQPLLMQRAEVWAAETGWRMPTPDEGPPVLGVDGCTAGWVGGYCGPRLRNCRVSASFRPSGVIRRTPVSMRGATFSPRICFTQVWTAR